MESTGRRLSSGRADGVEARLRARSEQIKPGGPQPPAPSRTPLGCCQACSTVVYAGDSLAMAGGYLFHGECAPEGLLRETDDT